MLYSSTIDHCTTLCKLDTNEHFVFIPQLMIVLSMKEYQHIIAWTPEGDKFTIHNSKALINEIFPKYFKQCKFPSFLRKVSLMVF